MYSPTQAFSVYSSPNRSERGEPRYITSDHVTSATHVAGAFKSLQLVCSKTL